MSYYIRVTYLGGEASAFKDSVSGTTIEFAKKEQAFETADKIYESDPLVIIVEVIESESAETLYVRDTGSRLTR
jgi:hypothetical protein